MMSVTLGQKCSFATTLARIGSLNTTEMSQEKPLKQIVTDIATYKKPFILLKFFHSDHINSRWNLLYSLLCVFILLLQPIIQSYLLQHISTLQRHRDYALLHIVETTIAQ